MHGKLPKGGQVHQPWGQPRCLGVVRSLYVRAIEPPKPYVPAGVVCPACGEAELRLEAVQAAVGDRVVSQAHRSVHTAAVNNGHGAGPPDEPAADRGEVAAAAVPGAVPAPVDRARRGGAAPKRSRRRKRKS